MKQYNLKLDDEKDKDIIIYLENVRFKKTICRLIRAEIERLKDEVGGDLYSDYVYRYYVGE